MIKIKLFELGKRQMDLLDELRKRGFTLQASELSSAISGILTTPKAAAILNGCNEIIGDWEGRRNLYERGPLERGDEEQRHIAEATL